jgi:hypothetical protein
MCIYWCDQLMNYAAVFHMLLAWGPARLNTLGNSWSSNLVLPSGQKCPLLKSFFLPFALTKARKGPAPNAVATVVDTGTTSHVQVPLCWASLLKASDLVNLLRQKCWMQNQCGPLTWFFCFIRPGNHAIVPRIFWLFCLDSSMCHDNHGLWIFDNLWKQCRIASKITSPKMVSGLKQARTGLKGSRSRKFYSALNSRSSFQCLLLEVTTQAECSESNPVTAQGHLDSANIKRAASQQAM